MQWSEMKVTQPCPTLCDPVDYTVHGILQTKILEWVAFPFSRGSSQTQGLNPGLPHCRRILYQVNHWGSPHSSVCKDSASDAVDQGSIPWVLPGQEGPLEKEMVTQSSILAWRISWTKEPSRLQPMGSKEWNTTYRLNHHHHLRYSQYWDDKELRKWTDMECLRISPWWRHLWGQVKCFSGCGWRYFRAGFVWGG